MSDTPMPSKSTAAGAKTFKGFSADERSAMKERAKELNSAATKADQEAEVLAKIAEMAEPDRLMAARLHEVILAAGPGLAAKPWYGMPAYAQDGKVLCFFQSAQKFTTRYATLGFSDVAHLDDGTMWPNSFALTTLTTANEQTIADLVKKAVS